ncbi:MAG: UvrD-helicase domain-containing protein [candidate division KSB1 bacterium]|nr:UvrD-helicase domain-containing protein [candidate division KSB1 bacterium]MDZ7273728.1 UvrD-helicase domain-containing protein [candidate division KSB1 bacterium]MDZ7285884.1 UvrD-helicase domain-containing protein [candidate division KSB1 bacterium]MDZ7298916.1 UvrD-helicase domain-containing protein [candidate division KSB1 bacterium]MDZ7307902.1 UvrD-helicase domain-containing protein [candidate division KSB1 bacterium]
MLDLSPLNPPQRQAVTHTEGPLLILAGAGSGKTRVITYRLAHLLLNKKVPAQHLLAVTFTNKAAQEMQERLKHLAGPAAQKATLSTFHALGVRILRQQAAAAGYRRNFVIYDQHDQLALVREIVKERALDFAAHNAFELLGRISAAKNQGESPERFANQSNPEEALFGDLYAHYLERTRHCNAVDFDDILLLVTHLLEQHPAIRRHYQEQFRYLMVDEYQDTNPLQYRFITLLLGEHRNLCVVGDDDQAIYSWRGADPEILLRFEEHFPGARLVKLEQNYRSTQVILQAANAVIRNNRRRKPKELWSALGGGARLRVLTAENENEEAEKVVGAITLRKLLDPRVRYSDFAVLVRTNFQLRPLEEAARHANLPYQLIGGTSFYERPEIRTLIAYLKLMRNPDDELSLKRALDFPRRGIGATTLLRLHQYCQQHNCNLSHAFQQAAHVAEIRPAALHAIQAFVQLIEEFRRRFQHEKLSLAMQELVAQTGYLKALEEATADPKSRQAKVNSVREFLGSLQRFEQTSDDPTLAGFLDRVSLICDSDYLNEKVDRAIFLTIHAAKGLEFPHVFLFGMNDGQFPSSRALESGTLEEERRLCYVALTRAQRELTLSYSTRKTRYKEVLKLQPSRFLLEIPAELLENGGAGSPGEAAPRTAGEQDDFAAMLRRLRENHFKV